MDLQEDQVAADEGPSRKRVRKHHSVVASPSKVAKMDHTAGECTLYGHGLPVVVSGSRMGSLATFPYRMSLTTCHSLTLNYLGENPLFRLLRFSRISSTPHPIPRLCKFSVDYADSKSSINHTCPIQHIVSTRIWIGFVVDLGPFYALSRCVPLCSGTSVGERDH